MSDIENKLNQLQEHIEEIEYSIDYLNAHQQRTLLKNLRSIERISREVGQGKSELAVWIDSVDLGPDGMPLEELSTLYTKDTGRSPGYLPAFSKRLTSAGLYSIRRMVNGRRCRYIQRSKP